jgi:hypothetical protein
MDLHGGQAIVSGVYAFCDGSLMSSDYEDMHQNRQPAK